MWRAAEGHSIESFPDLSEAEAERASAQARSELAALRTVNVESLPHEFALTVKLVGFQLEIEAQTADRYWLAQDYGMFPATFPVGPYGGGYLFNVVSKIFTSFSFSRSGDCDRYLALIEDYAGLVEQMGIKLTDQAAREIRIPQPSLRAARNLIGAQVGAAQRDLRIEPYRIAAVADRARSGFADTVTTRIEERLVPALVKILEVLGPEYGARAPEGVGMGQYKDGGRTYESLVAEHLSMSMTVEAIHRAGHDRMARIQDEMAQIRGDLGYVDRNAFHHFLLSDSAWVAETAEQVQARFDSAIHRIEPEIASLFHFKPVARYRSARLDPTLEGGMTYGYYQEPTAWHPDGVYYFNGSNLSERTLATAPSLIFHELIPGHHFHIASQKENQLLHPLRQSLLFNAFNEGWAEYSATLAGEIGMYADPCERYGRLLFDAFLTTRLVVDTGLNALDWSLEQGRQYMRDHTIMSESEIQSETLRYSTDIPAQSLAYKVGEIKILELRKRARDVLGSHFNIRDFHDAVLGSGGMPLEVLDWHVHSWLTARAQSVSNS
jgi:uncharacterized protein (DUF885 family)